MRHDWAGDDGPGDDGLGDHGFGEDTDLAAAGASDVGRAVPARAATTRAVPMASRI